MYLPNAKLSCIEKFLTLRGKLQRIVLSLAGMEKITSFQACLIPSLTQKQSS